METHVQTWTSPLVVSNIWQENNSLRDFPQILPTESADHVFYRPLKKVVFTLNHKSGFESALILGDTALTSVIQETLIVILESMDRYEWESTHIKSHKQILIASIAGRVLPSMFPISEGVESFE